MPDKANEMLRRLLSVSALAYDEALQTLPTEQGVYAIFSKDDGKCLHAGMSITTGVRGRVKSHLDGGGPGAGADLVQKVQNHRLAVGREEARRWIRNNCLVKGLAVEDRDVRRWTEHLILGTLQPIWGS